jgi:hypothetical protein
MFEKRLYDKDANNQAFEANAHDGLGARIARSRGSRRTRRILGIDGSPRGAQSEPPISFQNGSSNEKEANPRLLGWKAWQERKTQFGNNIGKPLLTRNTERDGASADSSLDGTRPPRPLLNA